MILFIYSINQYLNIILLFIIIKYIFLSLIIFILRNKLILNISFFINFFIG